MTEKQRKQTGKFLLIAQLPVYLFSIFIFSQFSKEDKQTSAVPIQVANYPNGKLNSDIPDPKTVKTVDKFSLIEKSSNDSIRFAHQDEQGNKFLNGLDKNSNSESNKLRNKLSTFTQKLDDQTYQSNRGSRSYGNQYSYQDFEQEQRRKNDLAELNKLSNEFVTNGKRAESGELEGVNETMDKLVNVMEMANAIENGKPLPGANDSDAEKTVIHTVTKPKSQFLDINTDGFNEFDKEVKFNKDNSFKASFFNQQTLTSGQTVKMKLDEPMFIDGILIPSNNFVFGRVNINEDRLAITISSIRYKDYLFPVSLTVYDYDGQNGIHLPGSITRQRGKRQASTSVRGIDMGLGSLDNSLETQAIESGANLVKNVLAQKVRMIKVTVKPHHQILIKNN